MGVVSTLTVRVDANIDGFTKGMQSLDKNVATLNTSMGKVGDVATKAAAATDLSGLSLAQLDAMAAGTVLSVEGLAAAEEVATVATASWGATLTGVASTIAGVVIAMAPYLLAIGLVVEGLKWLIQYQGDAALATETAAAKQDVINKAISEGAAATISYKDAIKFVNAEFAHQQALNPEVAYNAYRKGLTQTADAAQRLAYEHTVLAKAGLAHGEIIREDSDIQQQWTIATKDAEKAAREHEAALRAVQDRLKQIDPGIATFKIVSLTDAVKALPTEPVFRPLLSAVSVLKSEGVVTLNDIGEAFVKIDKAVAEVEQRGIPAIFTQTGLGSIGQHAEVALTHINTLTDGLMEVFKGVPGTIANAFTGGGGLIGAAKSIGSQFGSKIGENVGLGISKAATGIGSLAGPIGAAAGSLIGPLIGLVGKLFHTEQQHVNDLRDSFQALTFGSLPAMNQAFAEVGLTTARVLNAKTVDEFKAAMEEFNTSLAFQHQAMDTLRQTAEKYGFTLEQLGPALQRQMLSEQAATLFQDFQVLNAGGLDTGLVLEKMSASVNEFVANALRTGTEIPAAMQPMLQQFVNAGLLLDQNGNAITDLATSGLTFAETMTQGFNRVVESVNILTQAIARGLGITLDSLPSQAQAAANGVSAALDGIGIGSPLIGGNTDYGYAARGGMVTASGIQQFEGGGHVLPFMRRGSDSVPAMLTPGELVLNAAQQQGVAESISEGSIIVNLYGPITDKQYAVTMLRQALRDASVQQELSVSSRRRQAS